MRRTKQEFISEFANEYDKSLKNNHVRYVFDSLLILSIFWTFSVLSSRTSFTNMYNVLTGLLILSGSLLAAVSLKWIDKTALQTKRRKQKMMISACYGSLFLITLAILLLRTAFEILFTFRDTRWGDTLVLGYTIAMIVFTILASYLSLKSFSINRERIEEFATKTNLPLLGNVLQSILVGGGVLAGILIARSDSSAPIYFTSIAMFLGATVFLFLGAKSTYQWFVMSKALTEAS